MVLTELQSVLAAPIRVGTQEPELKLPGHLCTLTTTVPEELDPLGTRKVPTPEMASMKPEGASKHAAVLAVLASGVTNTVCVIPRKNDLVYGVTCVFFYKALFYRYHSSTF